MSSVQVADLKEIRVKTPGFGGGLNIRDAEDQVAPDELRRAENVVYDAKGGVAKRLGTRSQGTFGASSELAISTYTFYRPGAGNPQVMLHTNAGKLYYTNDPTASPVVWTLIIGGLSTTVPCAFETQNSKCWLCEGTVYAAWDGTTYTTYPGAPPMNFLCTWKDTMWGASFANPDRVYSSAAGDPSSWPALNYVDILHGDGDRIMGINSDGLFLIVGKRKRIQVIYDPSLFANRTADYEKGVESHFSFVHMEDKLYYLSRLGVCWWQGDTSARLISYKIDPLFRPELLNLGALGSTWAYQLNDRCGWAVAEVGSSVPTLIIEYYPRLGPIYQISGNIGPGPWTMHRMPVSTFCTYRLGSIEQLFGGHPTTNKFMWVFSPDGTDDGATFSSTVQSASMDFGDPVNWKYFRRIKLVGRGSFKMCLRRNFQNSDYYCKTVTLTTPSDLWDSADDLFGIGLWGSSSPPLHEFMFGTDVYGRVFSIYITDTNTTTTTFPVPVGSVDRNVTLGQWALLEATFDGFLIGLRD